MMDSIEHYVPHRGAMCLIDRLIEADDEHAVAEAEVPAGGLLVGEDGRMPAWATIEHMAQTVAAWAGARARRQGRPVPLGFLLGTRRLELHQTSLAAGTRLHIRTRCEMIAANGLGMFECQVSAAGQPVANAFVSVYEPEDALSYLAQAAQGDER
jgi:predicted hotdog family 3-hydroxylacyl-ACP dehydratase